MILSLIFLLGLLVRLALLWRIPEVHYDEAVNGLMARHILRGEFPIFYWGQDYAGTAAAFLMAVPFALFDSSVWTLRLVPLSFSLLFMLLSYRLARDLFDELTARLAMLYAALPPLTLLHFGVTAKNPYAEIPILGLLILLLTMRLANGEGVQRGSALALGLVGGIAWWTQLLLVSYLLAAGLFLFLRRRWAWLLCEGGMSIAGFLLGSFPFWLYNVVRPSESLDLIRGAPPLQALANLSAAFRKDLPALLGASTPWATPTFNYLVLLALGLIYLPAAAFFLFEGARALWVRRPSSTTWLLSLTAAVVVVIEIASPYAPLGGAKYLFPLCGVLPVLLAHYTATVTRALGLATGLVVALLILGVHTQESLRDLLNSLQPSYLEQQIRPPMAALVRFLRTQGISHVYAHFRISLKLTFDTREEIVATDWYGFRSPRYLEEVERGQGVALVAHKGLRLPDPATLEENLKAMGGAFQWQEVDGFVVFHDFRPPAPSRPIPPGQWSGRGLPREDGSDRAYDRSGATSWESGEPQRPGLAYELDLGRVYRLTELSLHPGPILRGAPRGYRVEVSADGRIWTEVVRVGEVLAGLHWVGSHPRLDRSGRIRAIFPPVDGRYVRVTQTGRDRYFWWSIGEIFLYEQGSPAGDKSPGHAAFEEGRRLETLAQWEYMGASPVAASSWRSRRGVDWDEVLGAYARAIRDDPELEEAHHRLAVVLSRLEIGQPPR